MRHDIKNAHEKSKTWAVFKQIVVLLRIKNIQVFMLDQVAKRSFKKHIIIVPGILSMPCQPCLNGNACGSQNKNTRDLAGRYFME